MKALRLLLIFALTSFISISCSNNNYKTENEKNEMEEITKAIHSVIGWAAKKDTSILYGVIANDSDFIEVQPSSRVVKGINNFKKAEGFWLSPDFKAVGYEIHDLQINLSKSGKVAWFYCVLDDWNTWKGQPANWENTRWTGVLEKRGGKWKMVQQHFSFAKTQ